MKRVRQFFSRYRNGLQRAGAVLLALAVWQGLAMGVGQQLLVPSPLSVVERLGHPEHQHVVFLLRPMHIGPPVRRFP